MQIVTEAVVGESPNGDLYPTVQLNITQDDGSNMPFQLDPDTSEQLGVRLIKAAQCAKADFNVCRLVNLMNDGESSRDEMAIIMNRYRKLREEGLNP